MTVNNPLLLNACLAGVAAAAGSAVNPSGTGAAVTAANTAVAAQALAIATAVDAAIAGDATISTAGATTAPTTGTIADAQASKSGLMREISYAAFEGQGNIVALPAGAQAAIVAGIVAKYTATISSLVTG